MPVVELIVAFMLALLISSALAGIACATTPRVTAASIGALAAFCLLAILASWPGGAGIRSLLPSLWGDPRIGALIAGSLVLLAAFASHLRRRRGQDAVSVARSRARGSARRDDFKLFLWAAAGLLVLVVLAAGF